METFKIETTLNLTMKDRVLKELGRIIGWENILSSPEDLAPFKYDASEFIGKLPLAVVLPKSEEQVSKIFSFAYSEGIPMVLRGGGTSLTGASIPFVENMLVVSFANMNRIGEVSLIDSFVFSEPGVRLDDLNLYLSSYGYMFPPDPASSSAATVGGCIANNSGGMRGAKFGQVKNWVLGLNLVLPDGGRLRLGGKTLKLRQGLDLMSLVVGSEGILAAVTGAYLKLWPTPEKVVRFLATYDELEDLMAAVMKIKELRLMPLMMEFVGEELLDSIRKVYGEILDLRGRNLLMMDIDGPPEAMKRYKDIVLKALKGGMLECKVAETMEELEQTIQVRRAAFPSVLRLRKKPSESVLVADIIVPPSRLVKAIGEVQRAVERAGLKAPIGGHIGDGNIHSDILYDTEEEEEVKKAWMLLEEMADIALKNEGSVSAEHGIGVEKKGLLEREFRMRGSERAIELMKGVKMLFDPKNLLNPGKVLQ
jgi:glycolate oxidase